MRSRTRWTGRTLATAAAFALGVGRWWRPPRAPRPGRRRGRRPTAGRLRRPDHGPARAAGHDGRRRRWPIPGTRPRRRPAVVTLTVTHPPAGDAVTVWVHLPQSGWNGRFQAVGGGGFRGGSPESLLPALRDGYAAAATDGGNPVGTGTFALRADRTLNWPVIEDFGYRGVHDMTADRQGRDRGLLRLRSGVLVLERLRHGRPAGADGGPALPRRLRRRAGRRPGHQLLAAADRADVGPGRDARGGQPGRAVQVRGRVDGDRRGLRHGRRRRRRRGDRRPAGLLVRPRAAWSARRRRAATSPPGTSR